MVDLDGFIADCVAAVRSDPTHKTVAELMARAIADPDTMRAALGDPTEGGVFPLYRSPELTVINVVWKPGMSVLPHNHDMWAVIGVYGGREDNIFWRRIKDDPDGRIEAAGARSLGKGEYKPLGRDIIHSVLNPLGKLTGGLHVYGGDFFDAHQSEWEGETLTEYDRDMDAVRARFGMG